MTPVDVFLWAWLTASTQACGGWIQEATPLDLKMCSHLASALTNGNLKFATCAPVKPNWRPVEETCTRSNDKE